MRTAASEYLNQTQIMSRLGATFGALIHEQVAAVRRFLDDESNYDSSELKPLAELAIRLVERSAEWLEVGEIASLAIEMREALAQLSHLRPDQRQEVVAQCRVALDAQERMIERLRAEGFIALVEHAGIVSEALDDIATVGDGTIVTFHYATGKKVSMPEELKERIRALEATKRLV